MFLAPVHSTVFLGELSSTCAPRTLGSLKETPCPGCPPPCPALPLPGQTINLSPGHQHPPPNLPTLPTPPQAHPLPSSLLLPLRPFVALDLYRCSPIYCTPVRESSISHQFFMPTTVSADVNTAPGVLGLLQSPILIGTAIQTQL